MKERIKAFFTKNWPRKTLSLLLAVIIWFVINKSLTMTKTIGNVRVRVKHIPHGKTIDNMDANHALARRISVTLEGYRNTITNLTANDFEILLDAAGKGESWEAEITEQNITPLASGLNLKQSIKHIAAETIPVKLSNLVTQQIPVVVTTAIGKPPSGYEFLNIWPQRLHVTLSGPEDKIRHLKEQGLHLTYNLHDILKYELDDIRAKETSQYDSVVSYYIPSDLKQIMIPELSGEPIKINDPRAKDLRIDFIRDDYLPLSGHLPLAIYTQPSSSKKTKTPSFATSSLVTIEGGVPVIKKDLLVKGVSSHFLDIVKDQMQLLVSVCGDGSLALSLQFINPKQLEKRYISSCLAADHFQDKKQSSMFPSAREEHLKVLFRKYMSRLELFCEKGNKLKIIPKLEHGVISLSLREHENK